MNELGDDPMASADMDDPETQELRAVLRDIKGMGLPEIVIGIVRAQGTDVRQKAQNNVKSLLHQRSYYVKEIDISELIDRVAADLSHLAAARDDSTLEHARYSNEFRRIENLMIWGDILRTGVHPSVGAMLAIREINSIRAGVHREALANGGSEGVAYVVRTLVQPEEVARLRSVYKRRFFLIGLHESYSARLKNLTERIKERSSSPAQASISAAAIIKMDEGEIPTGVQLTGNELNVVDTFNLADVFTRVDSAHTLERFVSQLFGDPHGTPTTTELGMAFAYLSARQSAALGRTVGAALLSRTGQLLSIGWNDVAQSGGGLYRNGSPESAQDHVIGFDPSDRQRVDVMHEFLTGIYSLDEYAFNQLNLDIEDSGTRQKAELKDAAENLQDIINSKPNTINWDRTTTRLLAAISPLASLRILNLIEFGRTVHAEMSAITDAARRGVPTEGTHLFVTTFPCHECARNIVASGVTSVTFVQPFRKSLADTLYPDSIDIRDEPIDLNPSFHSGTSLGGTRKVIFSPYEGIAPSRFDELFSNLNRKHSLRTVALNPEFNEGQAILSGEPKSTLLRDSIRGYSDKKLDKYYEISHLLTERSVLRELDESLERYKAVRQNLNMS